MQETLIRELHVRTSVGETVTLEEYRLFKVSETAERRSSTIGERGHLYRIKSTREIVEKTNEGMFRMPNDTIAMLID